MSVQLRLLFHGGCMLHHLVTLMFLQSLDFTEVTHPKILDIRDFSDKYFTGWNFIFQLMFLVLSVVCDIGEIKPELVQRFWPNRDKTKILGRLAESRDFIFNTFVFPFSIFVCVLFWSIYNYDRELALPAACDAMVHPLLNHAMHTNIVAVVLLEMALVRRKKPNQHPPAIKWIAAIIGAYFTVFFWTYISTGRWVYAVFEVLSWSQRFVFFVGTWLSIYVLYFLGCHANELLHQLHQASQDNGNSDSFHAKTADEASRRRVQMQESSKQMTDVIKKYL